MKIMNLPVGTKLMWDAPGHLYPAIVIENDRQKKIARIKFNNGPFSHWMGPEEKRLRWPTPEEEKKFTWPSID